MAENYGKAKYWWGVLYPENMVEDWETKIDDILQKPYCYAIHNADVDKQSEHRKDHMHLIIVWNNNTTYKSALNTFDKLSAPGRKALNKIEPCGQIRHCYNYLIHDTDGCKKAGKHLYDKSERISGNNFDIGNYEQLGLKEKQALLKELIVVVKAEKFETLLDIFDYVEDLDSSYFEVVVTYQSLLTNLCKGNYHKDKKARQAIKEQQLLAYNRSIIGE